MALRRILIALVTSAIALAGLTGPAQAAVGAANAYPLSAGATPFGVVLGPDNNIWVATGAANTIAKVTADGTVTSYPVPTANANPRFITVGSDGNLWFTQQSGNKIGRITTAGVITEFPVPTAASEPFGISPGPDNSTSPIPGS